MRCFIRQIVALYTQKRRQNLQNGEVSGLSGSDIVYDRLSTIILFIMQLSIVAYVFYLA